ncbi:MAG: hypothetical protein ACI9KE_001500 [Polyangiales bacterium]|jgi:hypothetical protein
MVPMGADKQAKDSLEESADLDGPDRTERVVAISFAEAKKALGEDVKKHELEEQPTKKMGALSAKDAEKVVIPSTRRSVRVFKHPSKPPAARLELPLATAQHQALSDYTLLDAPALQSARGRIIAVALILSFAIGAAVAWATHEPPVPSNLAPHPSNTLPTSNTPTSDAPSRAGAPASEMTTSTPEVASEDEPASAPAPARGGSTPRESAARRTRAEPTGAERADTLLEEAASLHGNELLTALEAAAIADPANPHPASALAEYHMENDPHEALEWALAASQLRRRRASYHDLVADAYERIGNMNDAAYARAAAESLRDGDD